jgi:branched-chain amino acid transport system permease protein
VFHFGITGTGNAARMTLWGILLAAIASAVVGALVALPALRLRGLYLALATMAFGVFVSRMVLTEIGQREIFGWKFSIFEGGSLTIPRPEIGPLDFKSNESFLMLVTVVFGLMAIGLVYLRHSSYGRRLAAMKDSPAACATLGMSVVRLKLSVFMLSAAIAGVGGVLMSAQLGSVNLDRFDIFISLGVLLITVVGGIGYTSGALFAGLLFGCSFLAMQNTLTKLGGDYRSIEAVFAFLVSAVTVMPATIGVTMGKNPSGAVTDIVEGLEGMKQSKPLMFTVIGLEVGIWALTVGEIINNWHFVIFTAANLLIVPVVGGPVVKARAMKKHGIEPPMAPELIGIDRPFTEDDRLAMEHALGLDGVPVPVATPLHHEESLHASA